MRSLWPLSSFTPVSYSLFSFRAYASRDGCGLPRRTSWKAPQGDLRRIPLPRTLLNRPRERLAGFPEGAEGATSPNLFGPARSGGLVPKGARLLLFGEVLRGRVSQ